MRAAALLAQNDNVDGAIAAYDEIIADRSVGQPLRDAARIRAGYLLVDGDDMAKVTDKVESLAVADQPWRHSARELLGLASYKAGKLNDAETWFRQIIDDREAPAVVSERARLMLDLIRSQGVGAAPAPETGSNENSAGNSAEGQQ